MSDPSLSGPAPASLAAARPLVRLLQPRSVAIVGASADPRSFGGFVQGNLRRAGYAGALHLVSRSSEAIDGVPCVKSIDALPEDIDVAVLAIPEAGVLDAVRELAQRRCHAAVLFASGYAETGDEGRAKQHVVAEAAGAMAIVGPNCMGYTNFDNGLALTFESIEPYPLAGRPGVGIVAQSGFMAATLRDAFMGRGLPITCQFSTGNEASVGIEDVLAAYLQHDATRVIAVYAEQVRRPALFLALARDARRRGKPIVMLMPGRSERAREAAASHTGALAGDHASASVLLQREAVVVVDTLDELFDTTAILLRAPRPPSGGTAFVTGSGAMKNIALDLADALGLALPALAPDTVALLAQKLPSYAVAENPLDYTTIGVRQPGLIGEIVHAIAADPAIGNVVLSIPVGPVIAQRDKSEHIVPALAACPKPAVLVLTGDNGPIEPFFLEAVRASGVTLFRSADRALRALRRVAMYGEALARAQRADGTLATAASNDRTPDAQADTPPPTAARNTTDQRAAPSQAPADRAAPLPGPVPANGLFAEWQGKQWLAAIGLPVPPGALARNADEAAAIARGIGYPVVLKAQASALPHKSDVGGVLVGLADEAALRAGWTTLMGNVAAHRPGLALDGALVEAMGARGLELVVGAKRDPDWGPVVLVGLGGVWIEALKDVRLIPADLAAEDIVEELRRLKAAPLLAGLRGAPGADLGAIARAVVAIGAQMRANPQIREIDVNPLVAYPDRVLALDALLAVA
jgi:acyl-CoA synthetase (NDP forming)